MTTKDHAALGELRLAALVASLRVCRLFSDLPESDLAEIAASARTRVLDKDAYLFREGEAALGFYVVQRGAINVHRVNAAGREQVIHVFRAGESMAEAALASPTGYPADARALEASSVLLLPKAEFLALVKRRPELAMRMLASMSQHLRVVVGLLDDLRLKDVDTRLANWLLKRCPRPWGDAPAVVGLERRKRILAAELGVTAETLSRTLAAFRTRGLIAGRGQTITVCRPADLAALARPSGGGD
jgi:CRP-like cAMP-binding protein